MRVFLCNKFNNMKLNENLPERFTRAIQKLYTAFHKGELDAMDCTHCAVGNLCNNDSGWANYAGFGDGNIAVIYEHMTGYSTKELLDIELYFIHGVNSTRYFKGSYDCFPFLNDISSSCVEDGDYTKEEQKELQFKGLCAVVEYLCELDNIPNVMDYSKLFETENESAKYELTL